MPPIPRISVVPLVIADFALKLLKLRNKVQLLAKWSVAAESITNSSFVLSFIIADAKKARLPLAG